MNTQRVGLTAAYTKVFIDWLEPEYEMLVTFSPAARKFWSCAGIRSAAIYQMKRGHDVDRIRVIYDSMLKSNISAMTNGARVFTQQYLSGNIGSTKGHDTFCRALKVFNTKEPFVGSKIIVRDIPTVIAEVREFLMEEMKKSPERAGQLVAKPGTKFTWKRAA